MLSFVYFYISEDLKVPEVLSTVKEHKHVLQYFADCSLWLF